MFRKIRTSAIAAAVLCGFLMPAAALATTLPTGDVNFLTWAGATTTSPLWGGTGSTQEQAIANSFTVPSSFWLCSVGFRITRDSSSYTDYLKVTLYQNSSLNSLTAPTSGTQMAVAVLPETELPVGSNPAVASTSFVSFDNCLSLQSGATYSITAQRLNADSNRPYYANKRTSNQDNNTAGWDYIGVNGGWNVLTTGSPVDNGHSVEWHMSLWGYTPGSSGTPLIFGTYSSGSASGTDLGVFGNAIRDGLAYLFIPGDAAQNAWTNFAGALTVRIPFSYVAETKAIIDGLSTASGSIDSWAYSDTTIGLSSVSFFSASTITAAMPSGFLTKLRTLCVVALWFAFAMYVYHRTLSLFG